MSMATCETCGNDYDKAFNVVMKGETHTFDSFECAIHALAPTAPARSIVAITARRRRVSRSCATASETDWRGGLKHDHPENHRALAVSFQIADMNADWISRSVEYDADSRVGSPEADDLRGRGPVARHPLSAEIAQAYSVAYP
jgi:hypothetical protein